MLYALIHAQVEILEREFERIAYETVIHSWQANRRGAYSDTRGSAGSTLFPLHPPDGGQSGRTQQDGVGHQFPAKGTFSFTNPGATNRSHLCRAVK